MESIELIKLKTVCGGHAIVARSELMDSSKELLQLYGRNGDPKVDHKTHIHRDRLDLDGSKTAKNSRRVANIYGPKLEGYAKPGDVKREIKRRNQDVDAFDILEVNGRWVGCPKRSRRKASHLPKQVAVPKGGNVPLLAILW